jgi:hypothetical protein
VTERLAVALLGTFESLRMAPTFARGRRDERAGHVRNLTVSGSLVVAQVRGPDDPAAFRARIAVRSFGASEWARVEQDLAAEARYAADLLAGRMPATIGEVFAAAGLSLVPLSLDEVAMDCTCERWPMPCVHLAAACYALARTLDEDPFAVFAWRGRSRDELLVHLRDLRSASAVADQGGSRRGHGPAGPGVGPSPSAGFGTSSGSGASAGFDTSVGPRTDSSVSPRALTAGSAGRTHPAPSAGADPGADSAEPDPGSPGDPLGTPEEAEDRRREPYDATFTEDTQESHADAAPAPGQKRADSAEAEAPDALTAELAAFWGVSTPAPLVPTGNRPGAVTRPDSLLDQLDPPPLSHDGRPIADVLRPAYLALPDR